MEEPGNVPTQGSKEYPFKVTLATVLIIVGLLVILFAATIILINLIPYDNKLDWYLYTAPWSNKVLLVGAGLLEFFFVLTLCIYIWKKGRNFLNKHL